MKLMSFLKSQKYVLNILVVIAFLVMSFWSLYSMPMDENGMMVNCPFMNGFVSFCQMNLSEHINQWQQFFTVIREKSLFLLSPVLLVFIPVALFTINARAHDKQQLQQSRNYLYQYRPEIKLFDCLLIAFSQGILNPKIYA